MTLTANDGQNQHFWAALHALKSRSRFLQRPVLYPQVRNPLEIAVTSDQRSANRFRDGCDPEIIFVQRQSLALLNQLHFGIVVGRFRTNWLAWQNRQHRRSFGGKFITPFTQGKTSDAVAQLT